MATTTNYGWVTPDDTDLVKDGAAAIRTLGSSVDTTTKALNPSTTLGDIEYRSATADTNTRLPIGSTGNILTVSGGVPAWVAPAGGGKVLQVVQGTLTGSVITSSTSFIDTGLSVSITPSSASSQVLVMVSHCGGAFINPANDIGLYFNTLRGATSLDIPGNSLAGYLYVTGSTAKELFGMYTWSYLDSPATTSATTYKTQYKVSSASGQAEANHGSSKSSIIVMEIGA